MRFLFTTLLCIFALQAAPAPASRPAPESRSAPAPRSAAAARPRKAAPFLFGCEWPVGASQQVKDLFWETGCNYARITGGGYGWATDAHKGALAELQSHGVKVMLQLGSHYPDGSYFALKDSHFVDQAGDTGKEDRNAWAITYGGSAWPQYSYASEPFRQKLAKDFTAYLQAMKPYSNVVGLLLHNEPGYHWLEDHIYDYNPYSIARFRKWLPSQHATIQALNDCWGSHFASFDAVEPPHDLPPVSNIAAWMDWRRFNIALIEDFLQWERDLARSVRPDLPCTTNISGPLDNWFPIRLGDPYRLSKPFDIVGIDIYPAEWSPRSFPAYAMDMARGAAQDRPTQVLECDVYSGEKWPQLTAEQRAALLESTVWTYAGHGARGILLWTLSGQQGFALTRGEYNPSVRSVRDIAYTTKMLRLGAFHDPARKVALCVDQDAYIYYGGRKPHLEGGAAVSQVVDNLYAELAAAHVACDVICADQVRHGLARRYRALVLAAPVMMDARLANQLTSFVRSGGTLVAQGPFAELDRWGKKLPITPGFGLDRVFGMQPNGGGSSGPLTVAGAQAATTHRFGKGTAVFIAGNPLLAPGGAAQSETGRSPGELAAAAVLHDAGVEPTAKADAGRAYLDCSVLDDPGGNRLVVVANPPDHAHPLTTVAGSVLSVQKAPHGGIVQAFACLPATQRGSRVSSGPERLPVTLADGRWSVSLPPVTSAVPVLFAHDAAPLLAIDMPATVAPGGDLAASVTCYNPSPRPLRGSLSLVLPGGWKGSSAAVAVPAYGAQNLALRARAGATTGRAVVKARLQSAGGTTWSVPVDVMVQSSSR